jgi:hypothetical protein
MKLDRARALAVAAAAAAAAALTGCGATTTVTTTLTAPPQTVTSTTTITAPPQTVTRTTTTPAPPDQSTFVEQILTDKVSGATGQSTRSFLQNGYPGATVEITGANCVEAGTTQHYQCTVSYSVSGASNPSDDGSYTLGATASCNNAGDCQTSTQPFDTASRQ